MALELIVLHMIGDFILQTDHMAARKLNDYRVRALHVLTYTTPFAVWLIITGQPAPTTIIILSFIAATHYTIDSFRFTLGSRWAHKPMVVDQFMHAVVLLAVQYALGG